MTTLVVELPTRRATTRLGRALGQQLHAGDLVVLSGPLGAGKTFLTRAICRGLGVPEQERVVSPTFSLVNELEGRVEIAHVDAYRLADEEELIQLALDEKREQGWVLLVEWGAPYVDALGGDALLIELEDAGSRRAVCRSSGPASQGLLAALTAAMEAHKTP